LHHEFTISLVDQVNQWVTYGSGVIPHPTDETPTTWWIGINDTGDSNRNTTVRVLKPVFEKKEVTHGPQIANFTAFWETEINSYFAAVVCFLSFI